MITIKFEAASFPKLLEDISKFLNEHGASPEVTSEPAAVEKPKAKKKSAKKAEPKVEPSKPAAKATREQVSDALQSVNASAGLEKAREILDQFGVARISEIKEKDFGAFVEACRAVPVEL